MDAGASESDPRCAKAGTRGSGLSAPHGVTQSSDALPRSHTQWLHTGKFGLLCEVPPPLILHSRLVYNNRVNGSNHALYSLNSSRVLVFKHGGSPWDAVPLHARGGKVGDVFFEDISSAGFYFEPGQSIWARQFNTEQHHQVPGDATCDGCSVWILGHKTEGPITVLRVSNAGTAVVLGSYYYPVNHVDSSTPVYEVDNTSWLCASFVQSGGYQWLLNVTTTGLGNRTVAALPASAAGRRGGGSLVSLLVQSPSQRSDR